MHFWRKYIPLVPVILLLSPDFLLGQADKAAAPDTPKGTKAEFSAAAD